MSSLKMTSPEGLFLPEGEADRRDVAAVAAAAAAVETAAEGAEEGLELVEGNNLGCSAAVSVANELAVGCCAAGTVTACSSRDLGC
jgi:hypothetical protein